MRILQVTIGYYPSQIWGGAPPVIAALSQGMVTRGHQVTILTSNIIDYQNRVSPESSVGEWESIPVVYLKSFWKARRANSIGFIWMPDVWHYRHLVKEADVVHLHGYREFLFTTVALLAQYYKVPYIVQPHGSLPAQFGRSGLKKLFDRSIGPLLLSHAAGCIALSKEEVDNFLQLGGKPTVILQTPNPLTFPAYTTMPDPSVFRERIGVGKDEKLVLFLSRLHEKKGLDLLIRAIAALNRDDIKLCIVGPDDGYEAIGRQLVITLGIEKNTIWTGPLYGFDKLAAYRAADVYVLPTRGVEGLPNTVVEAMHASKPVIITRKTEIADLIDKVAGIAVDFDVDQLAHAISHLVDNPALGAHYAQGARELFDKWFELDAILERIESLYERCLYNKN